MKTIYRDSEFRCHAAMADDLSAVETELFDGKCDAYIEGYRLLLRGEQWQRSDGVVFRGEMLSPWKPYTELAAAQQQYETMQAQLQAAYQEGVNSV